eukprot:3359499-Prymnesium_polylepis.1
MVCTDAPSRPSGRGGGYMGRFLTTVGGLRTLFQWQLSTNMDGKQGCAEAIREPLKRGGYDREGVNRGRRRRGAGRLQ